MELRDGLQLLSVVAGPLGVVVGWGLSKLSTDSQWKRARDERLNTLKLETYAEWAAGKEAHFIAYATQKSSASSSDRVPLCEKLLLLLEQDPETRRLIKDVDASIPDLSTAQFAALEMLVHSEGEWEWEPFRQAMDRLLDRVRHQLSAK